MIEEIKKELEEIELNLSMLEKRLRILQINTREVKNIEMHIEYIKKALNK
jgi:hypothetical protein